MGNFKFVILGAAKIAHKFCEAAALVPGCEVAAVASKSGERAKVFAEETGVARFYDSYEEMLRAEKPDCAYIAVTPNDHFRLTMLCLEHGVPVLCEKAMFCSGAEAREAFEKAERAGLFVMEAMWSRFLPAVRKVKEWAAQGRIGRLELVQTDIGFLAPEGRDNRYRNPALGGGAARDITVYAYELTTYMVDEPILGMQVIANRDETGVDLSDHVAIRFAHTLASLTTSFGAAMEDRMVLYGSEGRIVLPHPHFGSECFLYDAAGVLTETFRDEETKNGFTYEIAEAMRCVRAGRTESETVPHALTIDCAELFDRIEEVKGQGETAKS